MSTHECDDSLLIPDLLPSERLVEILEKSCVKLKRVQLSGLDKEELIILFHKFITPKPQRSCRDNRRGRKMKEEQERKLQIKRKGSETKESILLASGSGSGDRLKPPPKNEVNVGKKMIKLKSNCYTNDSSENIRKDEDIPSSKTKLKRRASEVTDEEAKKSRQISWP